MTIRYVDKNAPLTKLELADALAAGWGDDYFRNPRVEVECASGLKLFANHALPTGGTTWTVRVPLPGGGTEAVEIQPNGFACGDGSSLLVLFNARPPGHSKAIDYAWVENRWEAINSREGTAPGQQITYRNFPPPTGLSNATLFSEGLIMFNEEIGAYIGATGGLWQPNGSSAGWEPGGLVEVGVRTPPSLTGVEVRHEATAMAVGKSEGFVAIAQYTNGYWRDVTTLASWATTGPATINESGAATASGLGTVSVSATYGGMTGSTAALPVNPALVAEAGPDVQVQAGEVVILDGGASADAKGRHMAYTWDFGDDSPPGTGARLPHVFTLPGTYTVLLSVTDIEDNLATDTLTVTVLGDGRLAGHNFGDGRLDAFVEHGGTWGVFDGDLTQLNTSGPNGVKLSDPVTSAELQFGDVTASARIELVAGGGRVGLQICAAAGPPTSADGYVVYLTASGGLVLVKVQGGVRTLLFNSLTGIDTTVPHDLRVRTYHDAGNGRVLQVELDGQPVITGVDTTPLPGGAAGLIARNAHARFGHLFVDMAFLPLEDQ
ncbi:MAG: PKD domain-containing protein [Planctomycetota bacterium]